MLLRIIFAFDGTRAWFLFKSKILDLFFLLKKLVISLKTWLFKIKLSSNTSHKTFLVISSLVGPKPPVIIVSSVSLSKFVRAFFILSELSPTVEIFVHSIPLFTSWLASQEEFVLMIWPINISSPIVIISAFIKNHKKAIG